MRHFNLMSNKNKNKNENKKKCKGMKIKKEVKTEKREKQKKENRKFKCILFNGTVINNDIYVLYISYCICPVYVSTVHSFMCSHIYRTF